MVTTTSTARGATASYLRCLKAAAETPPSVAMLYLVVFCLGMALLVALGVIP